MNSHWQTPSLVPQLMSLSLLGLTILTLFSGDLTFVFVFFLLSLPQKRVSFEPTTTYLLKDLKPFTTYTFQLAARSKHGIGAYTNEISAETPQTRRSLSVFTVFPQHSSSRTGAARNKAEILHFLTAFANVILNLFEQWFTRRDF